MLVRMPKRRRLIGAVLCVTVMLAALVVGVYMWAPGGDVGGQRAVSLRASKSQVEFGEPLAFTATVAAKGPIQAQLRLLARSEASVSLEARLAGKRVGCAGMRPDARPNVLVYRVRKLEIEYHTLFMLPGRYVFQLVLDGPQGTVSRSNPVSVVVLPPDPDTDMTATMERILVGATQEFSLSGEGAGCLAGGVSRLCFAYPQASRDAIAGILSRRGPETVAEVRRRCALIQVLGNLANPDYTTARGLPRTALDGAKLLDMLGSAEHPWLVWHYLMILPFYGPELLTRELRPPVLKELLRRRRSTDREVAFAAYLGLTDDRVTRRDEVAAVLPDLRTEIATSEVLADTAGEVILLGKLADREEEEEEH